jgi:BRO family, N-terminal domain
MAIALRDRSRSPRNGASSSHVACSAWPPTGCSFQDKTLVLNGVQVPFIHFTKGGLDEIWLPAKPVMKTTGEANITQIMDRVFSDDKMTFEKLVNLKGLPLEGFFGFVKTPNPDDHNEKNAIWVNESGFYAMVLGSRKPHCVAFQRWVLHDVLPSIRRHGSYGDQAASLRLCFDEDLKAKAHVPVKAPVLVKAPAPAKAPVPVKAQVRMVEDERLSFCEIVKANCGGACELKLKDLVRISYVKFVELVATEERRSVAAVCGELRDGTYGLKARLPRRWEALAVAAVGQALAPACGALPTGDADRAGFVETRSEEARGPRAFVAEGAHGIAKDAANCMWIGQLQVGQRIFFLDSWEAAVGLSLRTARALLRAGHLAENLFSANPDEAIVSQLAREGVVARQGDWATSFPSQQFGGIYLDLCYGSLTYICVQLELATYRACPGCVLGVTVTERDFNGEPLLLRALSLQEFLMNLGWRPALQGLRASTLLHRSGKGHQVLTQFWKK